ncbi:hypothetical protein KL864_30995 [Mycolicibacterium goodii]|uniref:hypothetical protein n=1 Tax=Mycolicibacterium goodii TaxID=134601 RepID=UPI001BDCFD59|nr:hypothetical protein [Mycolicibacterium goodii]MBU8820309.1 hypothetical protein [Mycolicibacterium goodii]
MLQFPMPNTSAFGERIRSIRTTVLDTSQDGIAAAGGPSSPQQSRVENGQDQPISLDWLMRYGAAAHELAPGKFSSGSGSLFCAIATAYHAAEDGLDEQRSTALLETSQDVERNEVMLGIDLATDRPIVGRRMSPVVAQRLDMGTYIDRTDTYVARAAKQAEREFVQAAVRIARRFPGVSIVDDSAIQKKEIVDYWKQSDAGRVEESVTTRLDPIAGVTTLNAAQSIALLLSDLDPSALRSTSWIILLSNAIGRMHGMRPIDAYARFRDAEDCEPWQTILDGLDPRVRTELPDVATMLRESDKALSRWAPRRWADATDWSVEFAEADGAITWKIGTPADAEPLEPHPGDLWIVGASAANKQVAGILRFRAVAGLTIAARATEHLTLGPYIRSSEMPWIEVTDESMAPEFGWAPAHVPGHSYALLYNKMTTEWHAAQLF